MRCGIESWSFYDRVFCIPTAADLCDAAVGELGAGGEVQLLQPAEGQQGSSGLLFELLQVVVRHQLGSLLTRQTWRLEEAHVAEGPGEPGTLVSLSNATCITLRQTVQACREPLRRPPHADGSHRLLVGLTFGRLHDPEQTPVRDLFTPAEPQNLQLLQVRGDRAHRQVGHVVA